MAEALGRRKRPRRWDGVDVRRDDGDVEMADTLGWLRRWDG